MLLEFEIARSGNSATTQHMIAATAPDPVIAARSKAEDLVGFCHGVDVCGVPLLYPAPCP